MASFMSYFGARKDPKASARDAIVTLRQQLQMIEKKEDYLQKKIDDELKKAKANAVSNKPGMSWVVAGRFQQSAKLYTSGHCGVEAQESERTRARQACRDASTA